jgi:hypothetical protein
MSFFQTENKTKMRTSLRLLTPTSSLSFPKSRIHSLAIHEHLLRGLKTPHARAEAQPNWIRNFDSGVYILILLIEM